MVKYTKPAIILTLALLFIILAIVGVALLRTGEKITAESASPCGEEGLVPCSLNTSIPEASPTLSSSPTKASQDGEIPRVEVAEAKAAWDRKEAVFVDVRTPASYAEAHIAGAISIPIDKLEESFSELNPQGWIIPY